MVPTAMGMTEVTDKRERINKLVLVQGRMLLRGERATNKVAWRSYTNGRLYTEAGW